VPHRQHPQATDLLWSVEHYGREAARHLGVQANLDPSLDLMREEEEKNRHTVEQLHVTVDNRVSESIEFQSQQSFRVNTVSELIHFQS